jgi:hypothetical protein
VNLHVVKKPGWRRPESIFDIKISIYERYHFKNLYEKKTTNPKPIIIVMSLPFCCSFGKSFIVIAFKIVTSRITEMEIQVFLKETIFDNKTMNKTLTIALLCLLTLLIILPLILEMIEW